MYFRGIEQLDAGVALPHQQANPGASKNDSLRPLTGELIDDAQKPGPGIFLIFFKAQFLVNCSFDLSKC